MRAVTHAGRMMVESVRFGVRTRRLSVAVLVLAGLVLVALAVATQAAAPFVVYPFA